MLDKVLLEAGSKFQNSIAKVSVKNALNPLLWICGIVSPFSLLGLMLSAKPEWVFISLAIGPSILSAIVYVYFLFTSPDRLQSESYQLSKQVLDVIGEKGIKEINPLGFDVPAISNPDIPTLDEDGEVEK